ncbi:MAG TPA: DHA2 family efflux MFS transporter permease subunit [Anaerolineales bacterium]|nr:DHA2 family efflux MFS transporter permease subunit [Anaerolineales bacterium]
MSVDSVPANKPKGLERKWKVLISVMFGIFMIILDSTVVNIAFQTLRREFGATLADAQWVLSIYVLSLGVTTPVSGYLADRFGIKHMYLLGIGIFVVGSFLCGLAPSLGWLIAARALQGFGGGISQPLGPAQLYRAFPPKEQGTALGYFGIALVFAPALGPILGGWLVDLNLWRLIFFINIPIGILGLILGSRFLLDYQVQRKPSFDPLGLITAIIGFGSVLYAASIAESNGWTGGTTLLFFGIGIAALIVHTIIELFVAKEPMAYLRLFKNTTFLNAALVGYVATVALFGAEFLMPIYLQAFRGRTALEAGFILLAVALTSGVATPIAGRIYDKIGPRMNLIVGFSILCFNTWQLSKIEGNTPISYIVFLLAIRGLAVGLTLQTSFVAALSSVPLDVLPRGSSLLNSTRFVVQAVSVAALATIFSSAIPAAIRAQQDQMQDAQVASSTRFGVCETPGVEADENLPPGASAQLASLSGPVADAAKTKIISTLQVACDQSIQGFEKAYRLTFFAAIGALIIGAFLPGWPGKWGGRGSMQTPAPGGH